METEGIVLRSRDLGDRLRHISVYTEKLGKIDLLVKVLSKEFPLKYEPFSLTLFKLNQKGDKWEVLESKLVKENFPKSTEELTYRAKVAKAILPLQLPPDRKTYRLIKMYMGQGGAPPTYTAFLMKFLFLEGLMPRLFRCVECGSRKITGFSVEKGGVVCEKCKGEEDLIWKREVSEEAYRLTKEPLEQLKKKKFKWLNLIERAAERHLKFRANR